MIECSWQRRGWQRVEIGYEIHRVRIADDAVECGRDGPLIPSLREWQERTLQHFEDDVVRIVGDAELERALREIVVEFGELPGHAARCVDDEEAVVRLGIESLDRRDAQAPGTGRAPAGAL